MKATVIILSVVLGIILLGGVAFGAYWYGTSQNNTSNSANNDSNNNSSNSNVQPKVVTEPTCNADELTLTLGEGDGGGAGSLSTSLVFTNSGTRECTLGGYPGVSLVNDNGSCLPYTPATLSSSRSVIRFSSQWLFVGTQCPERHTI